MVSPHEMYVILSQVRDQTIDDFVVLLWAYERDSLFAKKEQDVPGMTAFAFGTSIGRLARKGYVTRIGSKYIITQAGRLHVRSRVTEILLGSF